MEKRTKKHYVAYMDILGYKDSLKNKPEASELYLETILKCIKRVTEAGLLSEFVDGISSRMTVTEHNLSN